ncbi:MAG: hypothetical protein E7052_05240 [Lentisphaerae bacterium]|nr:hypothetical protein [Lentisphaerota bacterium]
MMQRRFFTLVELIAAMAVMAMLGAAGAAALSGFQRSHHKVVALSERLERNRKLDKVAELMGGMIPFFWIDETDEDAENLVFDGQENELFFTAMRLPNSDGSGAFMFMKLYVNDDNELACDYKTTPYFPWLEEEEDIAGIKTVILAKDVEALTMTYGDYDEDGEIEWLELWDQDDDEYKNRLPAAVGFTVEFADGEKISYLRRTAGLSAYSGLAL